MQGLRVQFLGFGDLVVISGLGIWVINISVVGRLRI